VNKKLFNNPLINIDELENLYKQKNIDRNLYNEINNEIEKRIEEFLSIKFKEISNKKRLSKIDNEKDSIDAKSVLSKKQLNNLPSWLKKDIDNLKVIGSSKKVIQASDGKKYHLDNSLNDLSGGEWTYFLNSVISTRFPTSGEESYAHEIRKIHPSPKPPQLMKDIINFFTRENEIVFDYFMGVGGSLLGASLCNRRALGVDLNKKFIDTYKKANKFLKLKEQKTITGNSIAILKNKIKIENFLGEEKFSLILIDPPYGDMMNRPKTGQATKSKLDSNPTPYTELKSDLGNMTLEKFYAIFKPMVEDSLQFLKNNGHVVIFIKDLQPKAKETNLLHAELIERLSSINNLNYLGLKIWADLGVNLYPYGYPYSFVSNQIHQFILIFKKKDESKDQSLDSYRRKTKN
jgi:DNA modification methylase